MTAKQATKNPTLATMDRDHRLSILTARAIAFADRIIDGTEDSYAIITSGQPAGERLSEDSFDYLNGFFRIFLYSPDLRQVLNVYLTLENYVRTSTASAMLFYLPKVKETKSEHANQLLSLINGNVVEDKITHLRIEPYKILEEVICYGAYLEGIQQDAYAKRETFSGNAEIILLAAQICLFAANDDGGAFEGNPHFTESAFSSIYPYLIKRHTPVMAAQIYDLYRLNPLVPEVID